MCFDLIHPTTNLFFSPTPPTSPTYKEFIFYNYDNIFKILYSIVQEVVTQIFESQELQMWVHSYLTSCLTSIRKQNSIYKIHYDSETKLRGPNYSIFTHTYNVLFSVQT
jgi:hypothetical protein